MALVAFLLVAAIAVASALGLVLRRNPIHGALLLVVNLGAIAVLYLMLGAEFLAAAQVIIYAGAIMVLFVFAIMVLVPRSEETDPDPRRRYRVAAVPVGGVLLLLLLAIVVRLGPAADPGVAPPGSVESLGRVLFTEYLFAFELIAVLLLAAMVGAMLLARRRAG